MNIHQNARLTPIRREEMARAVVSGALRKAEAARQFGVCAKTVTKWVARFRAGGAAAMTDRSSRPNRLYRPTSQYSVQRIIELRRERLCGMHIAHKTGVSAATVSRVLKRAGLSRLRDLEPAEPVNRYQYANPGGLIHIDIKKLGRFKRTGHRITGDRKGHSNTRGVGWEYVHVCVDDASRMAFTDIYPDETAESSVSFLKQAVAWYESLGINVERVMTDNGACYIAKDFRKACKDLKLKHKRTKPYTPKTNGKAERFIQTALREWAYARAYNTSNQRAQDLPVWTHMYNWHRPHGALEYQPPVSRIGLDRDNLLRFHT